MIVVDLCRIPPLLPRSLLILFYPIRLPLNIPPPSSLPQQFQSFPFHNFAALSSFPLIVFSSTPSLLRHYRSLVSLPPTFLLISPSLRSLPQPSQSFPFHNFPALSYFASLVYSTTLSLLHPHCPLTSLPLLIIHNTPPITSLTISIISLPQLLCPLLLFLLCLSFHFSPIRACFPFHNSSLYFRSPTHTS